MSIMIINVITNFQGPMLSPIVKAPVIMQERLVELAEEEEEAADPEYQYLARQEAGLYTLQQVALIVGNLWFVGDLGVRKRLLQLLHQQVRML